MEGNEVEPKRPNSLWPVGSGRPPAEFKIKGRLRETHNSVMVAIVVIAQYPSAKRYSGR